MPSPPRVVLVSGCSASFGFGAAAALLRRGHTVVAGFPEPEGRHEGRVQALRREAEALPGALTCVPLDVNTNESVEAGVEQALRATEGRLDVLVNSAGYSVLGPLEACEPEQLLGMLNTNVVGALRLFRAVLPVMRAQRSGRIIQLTSGLGRAPLPFMGPYAASAWAQECFAEVLHYEAQTFGVEVAILEPAGYRDAGPPQKAVGDQARLAAYQSRLVALAERLQGGEASSDAEEVFEAVVEAVEARSVPLRTPIGAAAKELLALRARLTHDEYEREILERAGFDEAVTAAPGTIPPVPQPEASKTE